MADAEGATLTAPAVETVRDRLDDLDFEIQCEALDDPANQIRCDHPARWWARARPHECGFELGEVFWCDDHYKLVMQGAGGPCPVPWCGEAVRIRDYLIAIRSLK